MLAIKIYASFVGFIVSISILFISIALLFPLLEKGWISGQLARGITDWAICPVAMLLGGYVSEYLLLMKGHQAKKFQMNWATNLVYYYFFLSLLDIEGHGIPWGRMPMIIIPTFIMSYCGSILARIYFPKFALFARLK